MLTLSDDRSIHSTFDNDSAPVLVTASSSAAASIRYRWQAGAQTASFGGLDPRWPHQEPSGMDGPCFANLKRRQGRVRSWVRTILAVAAHPGQSQGPNGAKTR